MTDHDSGHGPTNAPAGDEPLDGWMAELAADYNRPPATPREEIWARIQAARAGGAAPAPASAATPMGPARGRGARSRWMRPALALAATLLMGIAIGRWSSLRPGGERPEIAAATGQPVLPADAFPGQVLPGGAPPGAVAAPEPAAEPAGAAAPRTPTAPEPATRGAVPAARRELPEPARLYASAPDAGGRAPERAGAASAPATPVVPGESSFLPYRVATIEHLGQAEVLLTAFRAEPPRGEGAPSLEPWARDLLTTTRLLLDSPAAADPRLGPLLGDLEGVLVQIVQLPAARAAEERQIIAQSLEEGDLLIQLRSAVPAGPAVPQRSGE